MSPSAHHSSVKTTTGIGFWASLLALFLTCTALPAWATNAADALGPGDSIRVTVFQNPDLTTEARLSTEGDVYLPLVGPVKLQGMSSSEAARQIAKRYEDGQFLRNPQINITVLQVRSRQVSILGQVARPGRYPLESSDTRLTDVLAQAGGITGDGGDTITLVTQRQGATTRINVDLADMYRKADAEANPLLENGDTIFVQRAPMFYIYGEVQRAGVYRMASNLNVMQALSIGGGITPRGTQRGMEIHRHGTDGSLKKIEAHPYDMVQPDDVIYVSESLF